LLAHAVQGDERLLLDPLHRHARHLVRAHRFKDRFGIRSIRLVATDVRAHVGRRNERHAMAMLLRKASPVMRHTASLHDHVDRGRCSEEAREGRSIQTLTRDHMPLRIRERQLEDGLCQVDGHCRSIHLGLLLVTLMAVS
jgi:hypothetical protein